MGTVQLNVAVSLDGLIADPDGEGGWLDPFGDDDGRYDRFFAGVGAIVMGATSYRWLLDHHEWGYGSVPTWVLTHAPALADPVDPAADVRPTAAPVGEVLDAARAAAGDRTVWLFGGGRLAAQFFDAGLVDVVTLTVVPVALGAGLPLFTTAVSGLDLESAEVVGRSGRLDLRYAVRRG